MVNECCAGSVTSVARDGAAPNRVRMTRLGKNRFSAVRQEQDVQLCCFAGQRPELPEMCVPSASANGQRVLCWICGQRSQGWRSTESSQDDSLREEQIQRSTAGARCAALRASGPRSQMSTHTEVCVLSARANGQSVLCWICGQR